MIDDVIGTESTKPLLVVLTGYSGAGHSVAIKALEDLGFNCIDNLPVAMLESAMDYVKSSSIARHALGMDVRDPQFVSEFVKLKAKLSKMFRLDVVFLTADEDVIANRYTSTRRRHPLMDSSGQMLAAIRREKALLEPIEKISDTVFDTSNWSPHQLAREIEARYAGNQILRRLHVSIMSFGFKYGQPNPVDSIFDVRFIDNPHFVSGLRDKTGLNPAVRSHVFQDERTNIFLQHLVTLHKFLLPNYFAEGKNYFRIGIGCTGGKHRSVCIAEELAIQLTKADLPNVLVSVSHRDINEINPLIQL